MYEQKFLNENGYLLIKQCITKNDIINAQNAITKTTCDYNYINDYIKNVMIKNINNKFKWDVHNIKFRVSNNNNSSDASGLHRDIIIDCNKNNNNNLIPVFTILSYLDETTVEIIPKSHLNNNYSLEDTLKNVKNIIKINCIPGDILIFYANMLHRGIFTKPLENRRLIQVFESYPSLELFNYFYNKTLSIPALKTIEEKKRSDQMIYYSKLPIFSSIINLYSYLDASMGYGNKTLGDYYETMIYEHGRYSNFLIYSSDALQYRINIIPNQLQELNKYIYNIKPKDIYLEDKERFYNFHYRNQFILYTVIIVLIIIFIYFLIKQILKK